MLFNKKLSMLTLLFCCKIQSLGPQEPNAVYDYPGNGWNVNSVQLLRNGEIILAFNEAEKSLSLRDTDLESADVTHVPLPPVDPRGYIGSALKLDGTKKRVAAGQWRTDEVQLVDLEKLAIIASFSRLKNKTRSRCTAVLSWSQDDNLLAVSPEISTEYMHVVDVRSGGICCKYYNGPMYTASINPDGKEIFIANSVPTIMINGKPTVYKGSGYRGTVYVYDIRNKLVRKTFETADPAINPTDANIIEFSPDGSKFAVGTSKSAFLGQTASCLELGRLKSDVGFMHSMVFNNDGSLLAFAEGDEIRIVKVPSLEAVAKLDLGLSEQQSFVGQLAWDGDVLAAAYSRQNAVKTWDLSELAK